MYTFMTSESKKAKMNCFSPLKKKYILTKLLCRRSCTYQSICDLSSSLLHEQELRLQNCLLHQSLGLPGSYLSCSIPHPLGRKHAFIVCDAPKQGTLPHNLCAMMSCTQRDVITAHHCVRHSSPLGKLYD